MYEGHGDIVMVGAKRFLPGDPRLPGVEADLRAAEGKWAEALALYRELASRYPDSKLLARRVVYVEKQNG